MAIGDWVFRYAAVPEGWDKAGLVRRLARRAGFELGWIGIRVLGPDAAVFVLRHGDPDYAPRLMQRLGARIGEGTRTKGDVCVDNIVSDQTSAGDLSHLEIGRNCFLGDQVFFDLADRIVLGDNVVLSGRVSLLTHADCGRSPELSRLYPRTQGPVVIGNGAWIGFGATVLSGVSIGENSVVAAGSTVTRDVPPWTLVAGTPAKVVRELSPKAT